MLKSSSALRKCLLAMIMLASVLQFAWAGEGTESGGGGGIVHDQFIKAGNRVLYFLKNTQRGQDIQKKYKIDLCRLRSTLDENLVFVYNDQNGMTDNRGSLVDGFTYRWKIILSKPDWLPYFADNADKNIDFYSLVFKEMLRSEGSHFSDALSVSQSLNPFPRELFLDKVLNNPFETQPMDVSCLSEKDIQVRQDVISQAKAFAPKSTPLCLVGQTKELNTADQLIQLVRETKCEIPSSPCEINYASGISNNHLIQYSQIFWNGKKIYSLPISAANLNDQTIVQNSFFAKYVKQKIAELEYYKICTPTGRTWNREVDKIQGKITDTFSLATEALSYEFVRTDAQLEMKQFIANQSPVLVLGVGSDIELLDPVVKINSAGVRFVRVRVINNTLTQTPQITKATQLAKANDEGYVLVAMTNLLQYLHPSMMILDQ